MISWQFNKLNCMLNYQFIRRLTWSQRVRIQLITDSLSIMRDVVHAWWQRQNKVNLYKCSISVITETQSAIQPQVTQQLNCTERLHVSVTIIRYFRNIYVHVSYGRPPICMPGTVAWQRSGLGNACQSGTMATLLNSLFSPV